MPPRDILRMIMLNAAKSAGSKARRRGHGVDRNPYQVGSARRGLWYAGWQEQDEILVPHKYVNLGTMRSTHEKVN